MARINIEECWWSDPRRDLLRKNLGSDTQEQVVIRAWRLAQEYWSKGKLVPFRTFKCLEGAQALLDSELAQLRDGCQADSKPIQADSKQDPSEIYVYIRGSSDYLSWAREQRIKGSIGGKKSAKRSRNAQGQLLPKSKNTPSRSQAESKQKPSRVQAEAKAIQASDSGSVSDSGSEFMNSSNSCADAQHENSAEVVKGLDKEKITDDPPNACQLFIAAYCEAYQAKYNFSPVIADQAGSARNIVKAIGLAKATELIGPYLRMTESWFLTKRHDLHTMKANLNAIKQFHETGQTVTRLDKKHAETGDYLRNQLNRIAGGAV